MEKKNIVLKRLELKNWRGQNRVVDFNENETRISGRNATGKSSLMKSFFWLLSSYPSATENKNYNLFDNTVELSPETPQASVKATLCVDGLDYTLERIAECKFVRRRASSEWEKASSDTYITRIDEIETSATDFNAWIEAHICPVDQLVYCLSGDFFVSILDDKSKARKVLEGVIGEIKDEDMKGDYSILKEDRLRYSVDMIEERSKNELKPYKKRQEEIPAIIADKERTLAEYKTIDFNAILSEIEKTKGDINNIDEAILGKGKEIEPIMGERSRILNLVNEKMVALNDARNTHNGKERVKTIESNNALQDVRLKNIAIERNNGEKVEAFNALQSLLEQRKKELTLLEEKRAALVAEKDEIKARVFVADKCAYCGQELPEDKVEEARVKFNDRKQQEYENVVSRGKLNKEVIENALKDIRYLEFEISKGFEVESLIDTKPYEEELANAQKGIVPFEDTAEYLRLNNEIKALEATIPEIPENDTTGLTSAKKVLMESLESLNRRYGLKAKMDEIIESINTLRKELREVGVDVAWIEGKIDKCKAYKQEKADIISYRVNSKLENCSIDMWSTLKDGSVVPDVVLKGKDGVRFNSLNFAHQIKTKIELQHLFMEYYGISLPTWIDESSVISKDNMPTIDGQRIFLFATDSPVLIVE